MSEYEIKLAQAREQLESIKQENADHKKALIQKFDLIREEQNHEIKNLHLATGLWMLGAAAVGACYKLFFEEENTEPDQVTALTFLSLTSAAVWQAVKSEQQALKHYRHFKKIDLAEEAAIANLDHIEGLQVQTISSHIAELEICFKHEADLVAKLGTLNGEEAASAI